MYKQDALLVNNILQHGVHEHSETTRLFCQAAVGDRALCRPVPQFLQFLKYLFSAWFNIFQDCHCF